VAGASLWALVGAAALQWWAAEEEERLAGHPCKCGGSYLGVADGMVAMEDHGRMTMGCAIAGAPTNSTDVEHL
jgi:hypothetical protein